MNEKKIQYDTDGAKLWELVDNLKVTDFRLILRAKYTGSWMTVRSTTVTGTVLAHTDFRNFCAHVTTLPLITLKKCNS